MRNLRLEELEARQLLNGSSFTPPPSASQLFGAVNYSNWITECLPIADYGGRANLFEWGWSGEGRMEIGRLRSVVFAGFEGAGSEMRAPRTLGQQNAFDAPTPGLWESAIAWIGASHPGSGPNAADGSNTARMNFAAREPAVPGPANANRGANGASAATIPGIFLERPNSQPLPSLENPLFARNPLLGEQGFFAARAPASALKAVDGPFGGAGKLIEKGGRCRPASRLSTPASAAGAQTLPPPQVSDLLAVLPYFDVSTLELFFQQFLEQLERQCPLLANDEETSAMWPWVVAVAAAATACEIARRELRRPAAVAAAARNELDRFSADDFFAG